MSPTVKKPEERIFIFFITKRWLTFEVIDVYPGYTKRTKTWHGGHGFLQSEISRSVLSITLNISSTWNKKKRAKKDIKTAFYTPQVPARKVRVKKNVIEIQDIKFLLVIKILREFGKKAYLFRKLPGSFLSKYEINLTPTLCSHYVRYLIFIWKLNSTSKAFI